MAIPLCCEGGCVVGRFEAKVTGKESSLVLVGSGEGSAALKTRVCTSDAAAVERP
jgi:hypothetical protein